MFNWFKKSQPTNTTPLLSPSDIRQWTGEIKAARSRFVGEINQMLEETELVFVDFDRGMEALKTDSGQAEEKLAKRLDQIDTRFANK